MRFQSKVKMPTFHHFKMGSPVQVVSGEGAPQDAHSQLELSHPGQGQDLEALSERVLGVRLRHGLQGHGKLTPLNRKPGEREGGVGWKAKWRLEEQWRDKSPKTPWPNILHLQSQCARLGVLLLCQVKTRTLKLSDTEGRKLSDTEGRQLSDT